jgi:excisionase family DNA binding protein
MLNKLLKGSDIAQILGISRALAYRLLAQGQISSVRFGRSVRCRPNDLEEFLTKHLVMSDLSRSNPIAGDLKTKNI